MNYEDRTDLESPQRLLRTDTVEALSTAWRDVDDKLAQAFDSAPKDTDAATEALLHDLIRPEADLKGAPPEAWPVGLAAARAGYRLAGAMLRSRQSEGRDAGDVVARVHRMYVYDLYAGVSDATSRLLQSRLMNLILDTGAPRRGDFEVQANLCFALGLAAAVVEFDARFHRP